MKRHDAEAASLKLAETPAYAGSTALLSVGDTTGWDHPRIRGEHKSGDKAKGAFEGSSPHTRGAPQGRLSRSLGRRDHPRIRGEHNPFNGFSMPTMGSSPHTRGAQIMQTWTVVPDGIIPAYAGSTPKVSCNSYC